MSDAARRIAKLVTTDARLEEFYGLVEYGGPLRGRSVTATRERLERDIDAILEAKRDPAPYVKVTEAVGWYEPQGYESCDYPRITHSEGTGDESFADIIPDGAAGRGRWRITVECWPDAPPAKP